MVLESRNGNGPSERWPVAGVLGPGGGAGGV